MQYDPLIYTCYAEYEFAMWLNAHEWVRTLTAEMAIAAVAVIWFTSVNQKRHAAR